MRIDLVKLAASRPGVTLNDIARAAHVLGLDVAVAMVRRPKKPTRKRAKKGNR